MIERISKWIPLLFTTGFLVIGTMLFLHLGTQWWSLPQTAQLIISYAMLCLFAGAIYLTWKQQREYLMELCILFFMALCFCTVILLSMTYQLHEAAHDMFFVGCVLTLPIVLISKNFMAPLIWSLIFLVAISLKLAVALVAVEVLDVESALVGTIMALPLLYVMLSFLNQQFLQRDNFSRAFEYCVITTGLFAVVIADHSLLASGDSFSFLSIVPSLALSLFCVVALTRSSPLLWRHKMLLNTMLLTYLAMFIAASFGPDFRDSGALFSIALFTFAAIHFAGLRRMFLFNFFLLLIGLRVMLIYYNEFPDIARSYVGLFVSAVVMMIAVWWWFKNRKNIENIASGFLRNE